VGIKITLPFDARFAACYVVSRAGRSRMGVRFRKNLERLTGILMIGLAGRLAFERR
jgi:threonine/homoserine/homoserine lactone efflux protein